MRLGITGTRSLNYTDSEYRKIRYAFESFASNTLMFHLPGVTEITSGGAKGVDKLAFDICMDIWPDAIHRLILPEHYDKKFKNYAHELGADIHFTGVDPLTRNHIILDHTDKLLAFPRTLKEERRSGTWATIRYARDRDIPILMTAVGD